MKIAVLKETQERERRVALVPDAVARLVKASHAVLVEAGAGANAGISDDAFAKVGAKIVADAAAGCAEAEIVVKVQRPSPAEVGALREGNVLVALMALGQSAELLKQLAERKVTVLALEKVPRITRAQSMDVLSSQATVAGYKAVLLGATELPRFLPMLTTAAGNIPPARAFVLGAGVAGLMAIATARRLGAVVSAFDVRAAAKEQVLSLGAKFVASELVSTGAETAGGYAKEQGHDEQARTLAAIGAAIGEMDLVVSTAAIPGKRAPLLVTEEMVKSMRAGSVIVDVSAETGGNCALTRPGETVVAHGVTIMGPLNLPSTVAAHASAMLGRNVLTLLQHLATKEGALNVDVADEITGAMAVVHGGQVRL